MPNWCINTLRVSGPDGDVQRFKEQSIGHSPWDVLEKSVLNFHNHVPVPPEVLTADYETVGYEWELMNWGCKWGACSAELVDEWRGHLIYSFDTAWTPPTPFLKKLASQWPTLAFLLTYEELGVGCMGIAKAAGDSMEDHCVET